MRPYCAPTAQDSRSSSLPAKLEFFNIITILFLNPAAATPRLAALPRPNLPTTDELDEIHEPTNPLSQRQQRLQPLTPQPQSRPSSSSRSARTLRRTPRLEAHSRTNVAGPEGQSPTAQFAKPAAPLYPRDWPYSQSLEGSNTAASSTQSLLSSYWPKRTTRISKYTANAIRYALEAVRADPEGSHPLIEGDKRTRGTPKPFTPDNVELNASMSDLAAGVSNGRTQNGGSRATVPAPFAGGDRVRTPTDIMRERRDREARKKAENERRQREQDEEEQRRIQEEQQMEKDRMAATAGVAQSGEGTSYRRSGGEARRSVIEPTTHETIERKSGDRGSGGSTRANITSTTQPAVYTPSNGRIEKPPAIAPDDGAGASSFPQHRTRPRGATLSTGQPRPVEAKPRQTPRAVSAATAATGGQKEYKNASINATAWTSQPRLDRGTAPPGQSHPAHDSTSGSQQRSTTSSFPHAFERWETLSSHWEGLISFWIRRLEQNKDDLDREPLNQQMARQVTDLGAAGANLFLAVVELQRLRASSERKFQRWFFETRTEQERFRESQSKFEQRIQEERSAATNAHADLSRIQKERDAVISQRKTAEVLVREKNRELSIAKEEARRAWEELGRREQEERDRTLSLKKGQATSVGGVHVVPMVQGGSTNRTKREDLGAGAVPLQSAQTESPMDDEPGYTTYDPARSETDTDPFTEGGRVNHPQGVRPDFDRPLQSNATSQPHQQTSNTSAAAVQAARTATSSGPQQSNSQTRTTPASSAPSGGTYLNYRPDGAAPMPTQASSSSFYQHEGSSLHGPEFTSLQGQPRASEGDERSYVPSVGDTLSEEDYDLDENGEIQRDAHGHPILGRRGPGSEDSDEYDVQEQLDRERMYGRSYGSGIAGVEYGSGPPAAPGRQAPSAPDYSGSGFGAGWEALPRHHHPTRLSDVLEEDERSRATPSRASR